MLREPLWCEREGAGGRGAGDFGAGGGGDGWVEVLAETFDDESTPGLVLPNRADALCGSAAPSGTNAACIDDLAGQNGGQGTGRLFLTEAFNDQLGYAWVAEPFDLLDHRVTVDFDFYIFGGSNPPADGLSVIFQLGSDPGIIGRGGGGLGTGGLPAPYVSVAFDIWDNGDSDPEGPCDGVSARTCHVEVNWKSDPAADPSLITSSDVPSFIAAGSAGVPVHASIALNEREIVVTLSTSFEDYGTREVIHHLLPEAPTNTGDGTALLGFAASTGGANANQAIDNLSVMRGPVDPPLVDVEPPVERGGINCGGESFSAMVGGQLVDIAADCAYGDIARVMNGTPTTFILRGHGRISTGDDNTAEVTGPIEGVDDPDLEPLYRTEAWSRTAVLYRYNVVPGRYRVTLHMAESCPCGLDREGNATRRYDVRIQGQDALRYFSPAEAAAKKMDVCGALLSTAVTRTFVADAMLYDVKTSILEVVVDDLGGGAPPGDAQLNGITFERTEDATGEPLSGEIEDHTIPADAPFGEFANVLDLDFDAAADGTTATAALAGTATTTWGGPGPVFLQFQPLLVGHRLRLAAENRLASAAAVVFDGGGSLVFDPLAVKLRAEFDVFIANAPGSLPADGLVFGLIAGHEPRLVGGAGGALGFAGIGVPAIGVEIDLWEGGGFGDDSGYNTDGQGHMAIVGSGGSAATVDHVQDQNDFDPSLDQGAPGGGWVDFLSATGFHVEVLYSPEARVDAYLTALDGSFPRRQVIGSFVTPFNVHEAMVGFFAGTGNEAATMEVDNVHIALSRCTDAPETARIAGSRSLSVRIEDGASAAIDLDGTGSTPDAGNETRKLSYRWSVSGPPGGAVIARSCEPNVSITFAKLGTYEVTLQVDDGHCGASGASRDTVTVFVRPAGGTLFQRADTNCDGSVDISDAVITLNVLFSGTGAICCDDAADTNDDGSLDITDPVVTLNYLFLGGVAPVEPFVACGADPTPGDPLECADSGVCR